jgi:adenylate cyclase
MSFPLEILFFKRQKFYPSLTRFIYDWLHVEANSFLHLRMRQLAAILFADMTGYTAMMQDNEHLARQKRKRFKEVLETTIEKNDGKILQNYGDGSLCIFNSAINSVSCAVSMQQQLQLDPKVEVRIGIHIGDIVMEDESIFGDGVNLASRVESLAVPGGVFISEKVFDEIKNHENIKTRDMGFFELKNVKQPVHLYAIANEGIIVPSRDELKGKTKQPTNRLAVLPFVNMSADPENEFFSDGITEELLNTLTKVDGLQVTSRTSAFAFKGKQDDIREIAIKLNVDKVLEGSVRKAGNRVRITAQLINAADGYHIWSETYDRNLTDIFEVQDEISGVITNRLRENLLPAEHKEHLVKAPTKNVEAYTHYLKGMHFWNKLTPADAKKSIECFEQAIAIEPSYAQAYAMVAFAYSYLGSTGQVNPIKAFEIVDEYSDKAIELDSTVAEGYVAKGSVYFFRDWNWNKAYEYLKKGVELNPGLSDAHQLLGYYYVINGKKAETVRIMEEALQKDPLSPLLNNFLADAYLVNEQYDHAIRQANKLLELNPQMRTTIETKAYAIGLKGDWNTALKLFEEVHRLTGHPLKGLMGLGYAYGKLGMRDKAMECVQKLEQRQKEEPDTVLTGDFVTIYAGLGDVDKAYEYINKSIDAHFGPAIFYLEHPIFKIFKSDPRYNEIRKKSGLEPL